MSAFAFHIDKQPHAQPYDGDTGTHGKRSGNLLASP